MSIWKSDTDLEKLEIYQRDSIVSLLDIRYIDIGDDYLKATMPVDNRTRQPLGILHGGASVVLAETLGSTGANLVIDHTKQLCVGMEINANHIRAVTSGLVTGTARPVHLGGKSQVWEIRICDEQDKLVCISRITMAVLDRATMPKGISQGHD